MGITGLIPFLEKASRKVDLNDLRGCTVAVDTYCWLHRGTFSCSEKLVRGEETDLYVKFCLKMVHMLLRYDIKPILVYDGRHLPAKALTAKRRWESRQQSEKHVAKLFNLGQKDEARKHMGPCFDTKPIGIYYGRHLSAKTLTEKRRRESRQQPKKRLAELLNLRRKGRHLLAKVLTEKRQKESQQPKKRVAELLNIGQKEEARKYMGRCINVTHEMALRLIRECRKLNVDCIVAPYEADAQMAWFNKVDVVQYVITEDSDLTLFGAKKVIFKLKLTGVGLLVESDKFYLAMGCPKDQFTFEKFRRMCILSGCDYLDSLRGIGLVRARKFVLNTEENDMRRALKNLPQCLNMRKLEVTDEYIENFLKAEAIFKHMFIFNPLKRRMERLHELQEFETDKRHCSSAGEILDDELAFQLALGNLDPFSLKKLDKWHPDRNFAQTVSKTDTRANQKSIWQAYLEAPQSQKIKRIRNQKTSKKIEVKRRRKNTLHRDTVQQ